MIFEMPCRRTGESIIILLIACDAISRPFLFEGWRRERLSRKCPPGGWRHARVRRDIYGLSAVFDARALPSMTPAFHANAASHAARSAHSLTPIERLLFQRFNLLRLRGERATRRHGWRRLPISLATP